ncbi:hypothetical protein GCM10025734_31380 [Kitasatospora paranensis]
MGAPGRPSGGVVAPNHTGEQANAEGHRSSTPRVRVTPRSARRRKCPRPQTPTARPVETGRAAGEPAVTRRFAMVQRYRTRVANAGRVRYGVVRLGLRVEGRCWSEEVVGAGG